MPMVVAKKELPVVSNGSLEEYISYVNSVPMLSAEEEKDLAQKLRNNNDVDAARKLVLPHLRLVVSMARGYLGYGLAFADLISEGTVGLMKAVNHFDERKGARLATLAMYWIKAELNDFVVKNWRIVRTVTTKAQRKLFFRLRSQREDVGNLSDAEATRIAKELDVSKVDVVEMNTRLSGADVALVGESDDDFAPVNWLTDSSQSPEAMLEHKAEHRLHTEGLAKALAVLDERSREIVERRWLAEDEQKATLHELADKFGISAERVRQIETKALQNMRKELADFND